MVQIIFRVVAVFLVFLYSQNGHAIVGARWVGHVGAALARAKHGVFLVFTHARAHLRLF